MTLSDLIKNDGQSSTNFANLLPPTPSTNNIFTQNPTVPSIFGPLPSHSESQTQSPQGNRNSYQSPTSNSPFVPPQQNQPVPSFMSRGNMPLMQFTPSSPTGKPGSGNIFSAPNYDSSQANNYGQQQHPTFFAPNPNAAKMFENNVFMNQPAPQRSLFGDVTTPPQPKDHTPRSRNKKPVRIG